MGKKIDRQNKKKQDFSTEEVPLKITEADMERTAERLLSYRAYIIDYILEQKHSKRLNTPFDDVFRTISVDCSSLLIPVINLMFGEDYDDTAIVEQRQNEHFSHGDNGDVEKKVSDMNCIILKKNGRRMRYQMECQSREDHTILVRLFEYATGAALESGRGRHASCGISPFRAFVFAPHEEYAGRVENYAPYAGRGD